MICFDIEIADERWASCPVEEVTANVARILSGALSVEASYGDVSALFTNDSEVHGLNLEWRGKDKPTNVLSFPADDFPVGEGETPPLGDLALAYETCAREAAEKNIPFAHHLTHLVLHGVLHLLGYDHIDEEEAEEMETLEIRLLSQLDIADPYSDGSA
ncbi:rRNA maturation RNase YbeY [Parvularcula sp. LCG005]|uniref:rRNA maturation RNase YbeY n=1 Tax=Parvularcula sp. LCG005 TaxID=3078805 RepID=UPI002941C61E|nr:rRNA maturation RNase YbeY [Parvularcula sp. LCG005]WOI53349.1 rRNA maturation RNase YbeY [Parvularcula sp. LCG005]